MKFALFAAVALLATPALAQTTGSTGSGTPVGPDAKAATATGQTSIDAQTSTQTPANDPSMSQQAPTQDMPATGQAPMSQMPPAPTTGGTMTAGGYQPSTPMPMSTGGQPAVFTPGPSVEQAYPAPAPLASYPICKKGQYDKCMQRGGR